MNKKFFCALTIAGMLMSPVSVLAEEMEEVEAGSVGGTTVEQQSTVKLDDVNFPDDNFRTAVLTAYNKINEIITVEEGATVKTEDLAKILTLSPTVATSDDISADGEDVKAAQASDADADGNALPFKDLTGIEYLTGLEYLVLLNSPQLKVIDVTNNGELIELVSAPMEKVAETQHALVVSLETDPEEENPSGGGGTTGDEENPPAEGEEKVPGVVDAPVFGTTLSLVDVVYLGTPAAEEGGEGETAVVYEDGGATDKLVSSDLYSLVLPEETANLEKLTIAGASQITTLDLSAYDGLEVVNLQSNSLADLNVSGCTALTDLDVSLNQLTGLDLTNTGRNLATVIANGDKLYEVELPTSKKLTYLSLADNKLTTIDLSGVSALETLNLQDNRLESLDVSGNTSLKGLNVAYNHLAALDLSENSGLTAAYAEGEAAEDAETAVVPFTGVSLADQVLYANETDEGIDLGTYDENFQSDSGGVGWVKDSPVGGSIGKDGIFTFEDTDKGISYNYSANTDLAGAEKPIYLEVNIIQADLMNRLYNPNSGEHFYTKDLHEKDVLVGLGWQDEGIGWVAPEENAKGVDQAGAAGEAVFRLYNKNAGDHHYTKDSKEKDALVRLGWTYEGVGWYSAKVDTLTDPVYSIEVYREYNPNAKEAGAHNYTTSENENDTLVSIGWLDEGIGWWALK